MAARTVKPRCSKRGCKYVASQPSGLCRKHLRSECDRIFSLKVRERGECESGRDNHSGNHQCAHGFSRRYLTVRWNQHNAWCFCAGCHLYFTHHPIEWDNWLLDRWGVRKYGLMRSAALQTDVKVDMERLYAELTA